MSVKTFNDYWQTQNEILKANVPRPFAAVTKHVAEKAWNDGFNQGLQTVKDEQLKAQERLTKILRQSR